MSLHDDLLAAIKDRPFCTTSQLADAVGEPDTRLVSRELGNLRKSKPITKNGQGLWCMSDLVGEPVDEDLKNYIQRTQNAMIELSKPSEKARAAVAILDKPTPISPNLPTELQTALVDVEKLLNPKPLPCFSYEPGIDVEIEVLARLADLLHPSIEVVLSRIIVRLDELQQFNKAKAA
jgi:hypothetical protein